MEYSSIEPSGITDIDLSALSVSEMSLNVIEELNRENTSDVQEEYNLRKRLYENKDAFHEYGELEENTDSDITDLKETVKKGQVMLKKELTRYALLKDNLEDINNLKQHFHEQVMLIRKSLLLLREMKIDIDDVNNEIDSIQQKITSFDTKVLTHIEEESKQLRIDYEQSFKKLIELKDVYKILKNSDITFACPICLHSQVDSFLTPCGHTYCSTCLKDIRQRCYVCRQGFNKISSLYFN